MKTEPRQYESISHCWLETGGRGGGGEQHNGVGGQVKLYLYTQKRTEKVVSMLNDWRGGIRRVEVVFQCGTYG